MVRWAVPGEPIPPEYQTAAWFNRVTRQLADLRAVLGPLLDYPYIDEVGVCLSDGDTDPQGRPTYASVGPCIFCRIQYPGSSPLGHAPACPVLRKAELLDREP